MRYLPFFLTACAPPVQVTVPTSAGDKLMSCYEMQYSLPETKYERQRYEVYDQENMVIRVTKTYSLEDMVINQSMGYTIGLSAASSAVQSCRETYSAWRAER